MEICTKDKLGETLQRLVEVSQFDEITVKKLVLESHVNRQTFYYHFQDKYDCLQYQFNREAERLAGDVNSENWLVSYLGIFQYIDTYRSFCEHVADSHAYSEFDDFILETINLIMDKLKKSLRKEYPQLKFKNQSGLLLFEYGLQGIIRNWFRGGLRENPVLLVDAISRTSQQQLSMIFDCDGVIASTSFKQQLACV